jgi:hypothetical protein
MEVGFSKDKISPWVGLNIRKKEGYVKPEQGKTAIHWIADLRLF